MTSTSPAAAGTSRTTRLRAVGRLVASRADRLAGALDGASTTATLARLRSNVSRTPGTDPTIWPMTVDGVPGTPSGDDPTAEEWAVHIALTLFATHQQSRPWSAHQPGQGLGHAVARLDRIVGGGDAGTSPVRRRFDATVTAASLRELAHHLRGLVAQMRAADVGLDYGMLADDLVDFARTTYADAVRRRWARQFHHLEATDAPEPTTPSTKETS